MSDNSRIKPSIFLYAILATAAALRFWGIDFGLPYEDITYQSLTIEEIKEVHRALKLGAGEYAWVFGKGGLYLVLFVEYAALFAISWLLGWVDSGREFALQALQDRTTIFLMGRITVALMGVATCYVIYRVTRRIYDDRAALGAALIGALSYFHAVFSAVINVDIGATLAVWLSILVYLHYEATRKTRYLIGAGALVAVAIAFKAPGAIALSVILVALATGARDGLAPRHLFRSYAVVLISLLVTLTAIAPEWISGATRVIRYNFAAVVQSAYAAVEDASLENDIKAVTVMRTEWTAGYLRHLVSEYNVALTVMAGLGALVGLLKRSRWEFIFTGMIVIFIVIMSVSERTQPERYLLPIIPAIWILGSRGAMALGRYQKWLPAAAIAVAVSVPSFWLIRAAVEKSHSDTRILAKDWIEANIPSGMRILMDGSRYRFSPSPPLNPDSATIREWMERARAEDGDIGRGASELALSVYEEALQAARGPRYELVSTVNGVRVQDISYYVANCFDYIVTSSSVAGSYRPSARGAELFPGSARFYAALDSDPRIHLLHQESAIRWRKSGPTISIYRVANGCTRRL
jgi:4-amino-4-deoxy-L-arabinose transferase-like glycosyltransferase